MAGLALAGVVLALSAFGPAYLDLVRSSASADQRFVAAVSAEGRTVEPGANGELVVRAAQKLCARHEDVSNAQRRATSLTAEEIEAVRKTFGDDAEAFTKVALRTFCP